MRTTTLTAAGLLGLALLSPLTAASAAGETCRGEAATLVGTGPTITGTEGRDVVVTGAATTIDTLGGDDLVCVTGSGAAEVLVDSGSGNDTVDSTAATATLRLELGSGADHYEGGAANASVSTGGTAGPYGFGELLDTEKDVVFAGAGENSVVTGQSGQPNPDVIDLGAGRDAIMYWGAVSAGGSIDGGEGVDWLHHRHSRTGDTVVDNKAGRLTVGGQLMATWSRMEAFRPMALIGHSQEFIGSDGPDVLRVAGTPGPIRASFGAGADTLMLYGEPHKGSKIDGGSGRDLLHAASRSGLLDLDMRAGKLRAYAKAPYTVRTKDFEDASLHARRVVLAGTNGRNDLAFDACRAVIRGRGGADSTTQVEDFVIELFLTWETCPARIKTRINGGAGRDRLEGSYGKDVLRGGRGRDRLDGGNGNDRLYGGKGRDRADGGPGRKDLCRAERERRCER